MDDNSIGACQGLPWIFDKFSLIGTFASLDESGALTGFTAVSAGQRRGELPLESTADPVSPVAPPG